MSLAPSSYFSLYSSPLWRNVQSRQQALGGLLVQSNRLLVSVSNNGAFPGSVSGETQLGGWWNVATVRALSEMESQTSAPESSEGGEVEYEQYEVEIEQPYGLKFTKGRDGGTYIDAIAPGGSANKTGMFSVKDKVWGKLAVELRTEGDDKLILSSTAVLTVKNQKPSSSKTNAVIMHSPVFRTEIWPAAEYGRAMYTIRQRIGPLLMKMQKRYGKVDDSGELTEKEIIRAKRNSGVISNRVREIQLQNYLRKNEQKAQREKVLREGLQLYKYRLASRLSKMPWKRDLKILRELGPILIWGTSEPLEEFEPLLKKFDESFINENAINAIKSLFGFNKK